MFWQLETLVVNSLAQAALQILTQIHVILLHRLIIIIVLNSPIRELKLVIMLPEKLVLKLVHVAIWVEPAAWLLDLPVVVLVWKVRGI